MVKIDGTVWPTRVEPARFVARAQGPMQLGTSDIKNLIREAIQIEAEALEHLLAGVDDAYVDAVKVILAAKGKVVLTGVGKSGLIGQKIAATLASTGTLAIFLHPTEAIHGDLGQVTPSDVVIALSKSGESEELNNLLPALRKIGARLIAITGDRGSTLARAADVILYYQIPREACPFDLAPTASTTVTLAIGDAIAMALMKLRDFQPRDFALYHPGGRLGRRLLLRVEDLMIPTEACAVLSANGTRMEDVLVALSRYGHGIVIFLQGDGTLGGILTDGDLRRLLAQHREAVFDLRPNEVMNPSPATVSPSIPAVEVLEFMEARDRPLNVVPVIDERRHVLGIARLHEFLKVA
ncbi:MAG: KpsF/GutQ family sugar-phosphate isomerase [Gammaproteobacteria bacterium]